MLPDLFHLGPVTVYTYGVLLAAAYLLGLKLAMTRARARGLDATRMLDLGIYIIISALVGAKLLLLIVDFDQFRRDPAELLSLARSGGDSSDAPSQIGLVAEAPTWTSPSWLALARSPPA